MRMLTMVTSKYLTICVLPRKVEPEKLMWRAIQKPDKKVMGNLKTKAAMWGVKAINPRSKTWARKTK